jgi:acetyl-CoA acetyltransferase
MSTASDHIVIVAAKRTPIGSFQGQLASLSSPQLAAAAIAAALEQSEVGGADISEAIIGCALPGGVGQAPARQAILVAGLPRSVACTNTMAAMRELELPHARVNVNGGACALGHPIGASGARLLVTLIHALKQRGGGRGIASLCLGGGEATAVAVELA